jgi:hypothetical protein
MQLSIAVMLSGTELSFCLNIYEIATHECLRYMPKGVQLRVNILPEGGSKFLRLRAVIVIRIMLKKSLTSMPMCYL